MNDGESFNEETPEIKILVNPLKPKETFLIKTSFCYIFNALSSESFFFLKRFIFRCEFDAFVSN